MLGSLLDTHTGSLLVLEATEGEGESSGLGENRVTSGQQVRSSGLISRGEERTFFWISAKVVLLVFILSW